MTEDKIQADFDGFHSAHPEIWRQWCDFTWQLIDAGYKHGSAKMVAERIRWETALRGDDRLKLNNNYTSRYARKFHKAFPHRAGFFRTRKLKDNSVNSTRFVDPIYAE